MSEPIIITESAKKRFSELSKSLNYNIIRFGLKSGGCSGFQYYLEPSDSNQINELDEIIEFDNIKIIIDNFSLIYLIGTTIDWVDDLMGAHFIFNSPKQSGMCGCKTSVNFKV